MLFRSDENSVAGVVAAGVADDDVRILRQHVNDFAFAFVAPLSADQNCVCHIFQTRPRWVFAIKIPERGFGAKRMSLRWEVRDGEERCQFRKADCDKDGRIRGHGVRTSLTLLAGAGGDKLPDIFK